MAQNAVVIEITGKATGIDKAVSEAQGKHDEFAKKSAQSGKNTAAAWVPLNNVFQSVGASIQQNLGIAVNSSNAFARGASTAAATVQESFGAMPSVFGSLSRAIVGVAVAIGGIMSMRAAAEAAATFSEEAMTLGRALGTSATNASIWMAVLDDIGASTADLEGASTGLARRLKTNEEQMNRLGLVTRDANGDFRNMNDMLLDGIAVIQGYKSGTDQAMAAQEIFGKGVAANSKLLLASKEAFNETGEFARRLGLIVGAENVEAWKEYDGAMDKVHLAMKAFKTTIGNAVMPVLAKLGEWFAQIAPAAIVVIKGAIGGLISVFWGLKNAVVIVWETINAMVVTVAEPIRGLAESMGRALQGDFSGAAASIKNIGTVVKGAWVGAMDKMVSSSRDTRDKIWNLFSTPTDLAAGKSGKAFVGKPEKEKGGKNAAEKKLPDAPDSFMGTYDARLEQAKNTFAMENSLREMSKTQEAEYWKSILANYDVTAKDRLAITLKIQKLELESKRDLAQQLTQIDQIHAEGKRNADLSRIDELQSIAQQEFDLGLISKEQLLAQERTFIEQRMAIEQEFIDRKLALAALDPEKNLVLLEQLEQQKAEIRSRYAQQMAEKTRQIATETQAPMTTMFQSLESGFANVFAGVLRGTTSMGGAIKSMASVVVDTVASMLAQIAAKWIVNKTIEMTIGKTAALSQISANAGVAATAAMASVAAIPLVGWAMAPAVGASTAAIAMGYSSLAIAERGYDVPAGLNPLTQLHEEEMVLPKNLANVVRGMAGQNDSVRAEPAQPINFYITAMDGYDVERVLMQNGPALETAIRARMRDFGRS